MQTHCPVSSTTWHHKADDLVNTDGAAPPVTKYDPWKWLTVDSCFWNYTPPPPDYPGIDIVGNQNIYPGVNHMVYLRIYPAMIIYKPLSRLWTGLNLWTARSHEVNKFTNSLRIYPPFLQLHDCVHIMYYDNKNGVRKIFWCRFSMQ